MGIFQARILGWVAMPSSRGSSQLRNQTQVSQIAGGFFTVWATHICVTVLIFLFLTYFTLNRASQVAQLVKNLPAVQKTPVLFLGQEVPLQKGQATYPTPVFLGCPDGSGSKESSAMWEGLIPGLGRSPGGGHVYPLWYSCLENPHG